MLKSVQQKAVFFLIISVLVKEEIRLSTAVFLVTHSQSLPQWPWSSSKIPKRLWLPCRQEQHEGEALTSTRPSALAGE